MADSFGKMARELMQTLYASEPNETFFAKLGIWLSVMLELDSYSSEDLSGGALLLLMLNRDVKMPVRERRLAHELEIRLIRLTCTGEKDEFHVGADYGSAAEPWENAEEMFGENGMIVTPDGGTMTLEELKVSGLESVKTTTTKPTGNVVCFEERLIYHSDGRFERQPLYRVQPDNPPDGVELYNDYAQLFLNGLGGRGYDNPSVTS